MQLARQDGDNTDATTTDRRVRCRTGDAPVIGPPHPPSPLAPKRESMHWKSTILILTAACGILFSSTGMPRLEWGRDGQYIKATMTNTELQRVIYAGRMPTRALTEAQLAVAPLGPECQGNVMRSNWKSGVVMMVSPVGSARPISGSGRGELLSLDPTMPPLAGQFEGQTYKVYATNSYAEDGRLSCPGIHAITRYSLARGWNTLVANSKITPTNRYTIVQGSGPGENVMTLASLGRARQHARPISPAAQSGAPGTSKGARSVHQLIP